MWYQCSRKGPFSAACALVFGPSLKAFRSRTGLTPALPPPGKVEKANRAQMEFLNNPLKLRQ